MKKLLRLIEVLIVVSAIAVVFSYIVDTAPWQVRLACGVLMIGYIVHSARSMKR